MRTFLISLTFACLGTLAHAQNLDVDFKIHADGQAAGCPSSVVAGLDPNGDGFLAVRTGPGSNYRKIDELRNGAVVSPCARNGKWYGVSYDNRRKKGWVHGNWLRDLAG